MFLLDSLLINGLEWVFDKVRVAADAEADDETGLRESLLDGQTRLEAGEISDAEYAALEQDVLERLSAARRRRRGDAGEVVSTADYRVTGADVAVTGDDDER
jgi:hypothetical protein